LKKQTGAENNEGKSMGSRLDEAKSPAASDRLSIMSKISAYIIAYNEAEKIGAAIQSVLWVDEIVVADSFSTDGTAEIAESMGARLIQIPFQGFGELRNQAMAVCTHEWIFSLDADERCTPEARNEILQTLRSGSAHDAYFLPRRNFFMGRWIKHSGFYPDYRQPQLFRKGTLVYASEPVHEGFLLRSSKPAGYLKNAIWQVPFKNLDEIQKKASRYSSLWATKMTQAGENSGMAKALLHGLWAFFHHFILRLGFLDGWAGFVIAFGNLEGTFFKYAKLYETKAAWAFPESCILKRE
jgi:glycosyltransferase involved in cell wall biosynthesis